MSNPLPIRPRTAVRRPISALANKRRAKHERRPASAPPELDDNDDFEITPSRHFEQRQISILRDQKKLEREERRRQEQAVRANRVSEEDSADLDDGGVGQTPRRVVIEERDRNSEHGKDYTLRHAVNLSLQLRWDVDGPPCVDLDISCIAFDERLRVLEVVNFKNNASKLGGIQHSSTPTESPQTLTLDLNALSPTFHVLMFVVTNDTEQGEESNYRTRSADYGGASVTVFDEDSATVLFNFALDLTMTQAPNRLGNAIIGAFYRSNILARRRLADTTPSDEPFPARGWRVRVFSQLIASEESQVWALLPRCRHLLLTERLWAPIFIHIEYCVAKRPSASLRGSAFKFLQLFHRAAQALHDYSALIKVVGNLPSVTRDPRIGAFEVSLLPDPAAVVGAAIAIPHHAIATTSAAAARNEAAGLLFSKRLERLWPHPSLLVERAAEALARLLAPSLLAPDLAVVAATPADAIQGLPLPAANVAVFGLPKQSAETQAKADARGVATLRLSEGTYQLVGELQGHIRALSEPFQVRRHTKYPLEVALRLAPCTFVVSGHVSDANGRSPLADIKVSLEECGKDGKSTRVVTCSDRRGLFQFTTRASVYQLRFEHESYCCMENGVQGDYKVRVKGNLHLGEFLLYPTEERQRNLRIAAVREQRELQALSVMRGRPLALQHQVEAATDAMQADDGSGLHRLSPENREAAAGRLHAMLLALILSPDTPPAAETSDLQVYCRDPSAKVGRLGDPVHICVRLRDQCGRAVPAARGPLPSVTVRREGREVKCMPLHASTDGCTAVSGFTPPQDGVYLVSASVGGTEAVNSPARIKIVGGAAVGARSPPPVPAPTVRWGGSRKEQGSKIGKAHLASARARQDLDLFFLLPTPASSAVPLAAFRRAVAHTVTELLSRARCASLCAGAHLWSANVEHALQATELGEVELPETGDWSEEDVEEALMAKIMPEEAGGVPEVLRLASMPPEDEDGAAGAERPGAASDGSGCACEGLERALQQLKVVAWRRNAVKICVIFFPVHLQPPGGGEARERSCFGWKVMEEGALAAAGVTLAAVMVPEPDESEALQGGARQEELDVTLHAGRCAQTVCRHCHSPPIRFAAGDSSLAALVGQTMEEAAEEACFKHTTLNHAVSVAQIPTRSARHKFVLSMLPKAVARRSSLHLVHAPPLELSSPGGPQPRPPDPSIARALGRMQRQLDAVSAACKSRVLQARAELRRDAQRSGLMEGAEEAAQAEREAAVLASCLREFVAALDPALGPTVDLLAFLDHAGMPHINRDDQHASLASVTKRTLQSSSPT